MYDEYLLKMFEEFKKAYGINDSYNNFNRYQDLFVDWIAKKRYAARGYVKLFEYMNRNDNMNYVLAEFGKGIFDTVTIEMSKTTSYHPIVISPYASTINKYNEIFTYDGELLVLDDRVIVKYFDNKAYYLNPNCDPNINDKIKMFMTQMPYSKK